MEALDSTACFMVDDDLLNFTLDEQEDDEDKTAAAAAAAVAVVAAKAPSSYSLESSNPFSQDPDGDDLSRSFPEFVEEELEWLSNKDAFPAVETCFDILSDHPGMGPDHLSPVSVLENSTSSSNSNGSGTITSCCGTLKVPVNFPVRSRSKMRRIRRNGGFPDLPGMQCWFLNQVHVKSAKQKLALPSKTKASAATIGRRCQHCQVDKTPQWRAGPMGPKTLCNACGVRYKSGRLVPEYRPANSPTFSSILHSNSHRKIIEMRKQKQLVIGEMMVNEDCGYMAG